MYDEATDGKKDLYSVRTSKIIKYSNLISESLNLSVVAVGTGAGIYIHNKELIKECISLMDIGGYINTITSIAYNNSVQSKIK